MSCVRCLVSPIFYPNFIVSNGQMFLNCPIFPFCRHPPPPPTDKIQHIISRYTAYFYQSYRSATLPFETISADDLEVVPADAASWLQETMKNQKIIKKWLVRHIFLSCANYLNLKRVSANNAASILRKVNFGKTITCHIRYLNSV